MGSANPLPKSASGLMYSHLHQLNILYDDFPMELPLFMSMLKNDQTELININLSGEHRCLLEYTKKYWTLSFDFDIRRTGGKRKTQRVTDEQKEKIVAGKEEANNFMKLLRDENLEVFSVLKTSTDFKR